MSTRTAKATSDAQKTRNDGGRITTGSTRRPNERARRMECETGICEDCTTEECATRLNVAASDALMDIFGFKRNGCERIQGKTDTISNKRQGKTDTLSNKSQG